MDRNRINAFWKRRTLAGNPRVATHFREDETHLFDLRLIERHITKTSDVLDLGCGTCCLSNLLADKVRHIKAVDKFPDFLRHARACPNLETVASDLLDFRDSAKFDVILLFGVMIYFDYEESLRIYRNCRGLLKENGALLVKHGCGVREDVLVDKFSEQIGDHYLATYKHFQKEKELLEGLFQVEALDIYPPRYNPWPNTHYYAFVCRKAPAVA